MKLRLALLGLASAALLAGFSAGCGSTGDDYYYVPAECSIANSPGLDWQFTNADGTVTTQDSKIDPSVPVHIDITGVVEGDGSSLQITDCPPAADCDVENHYSFALKNLGGPIDLGVPVGAFVNLTADLSGTSNDVALMRATVANVAYWNGSDNPVEQSSRVYALIGAGLNPDPVGVQATQACSEDGEGYYYVRSDLDFTFSSFFASAHFAIAEGKQVEFVVGDTDQKGSYLVENLASHSGSDNDFQELDKYIVLRAEDE